VQQQLSRPTTIVPTTVVPTNHCANGLYAVKKKKKAKTHCAAAQLSRSNSCRVQQ
jgi:hypothetical protein